MLGSLLIPIPILVFNSHPSLKAPPSCTLSSQSTRGVEASLESGERPQHWDCAPDYPERARSFLLFPGILFTEVNSPGLESYKFTQPVRT